MTTCAADNVCGTGTWNGGGEPGDPNDPTGPSTDVLLRASSAFGGIDVDWTYPSRNPQLVAHFQLFRSDTSNVGGAVQIATVAGSTFYDKMIGTDRKYYWLKVISLNGTASGFIGPATAIPGSLVDTIITTLEGEIDEGLLATTLRSSIDNISLNYQAIIDETDRRIADNESLSSALDLIGKRTSEVETFVNKEITQRKEGDTALAQEVTLIAAANKDNTALITEERTARVTADDALTLLQTTLHGQVNNPVTGLPATRSTLINSYYTKNDADKAIAAANLTLNTAFYDPLTGHAATRSLLLNDYYTKSTANQAISNATMSLVSQTGLTTILGGYTNTAALQNNYYTKTDTNSAITVATEKLAAKTTFNNYTTTADLERNYYTKTGANTAIANAATTLQVVGPNGVKSSLQQQMTAQYDLNKGYSAMYTIKLDVNGVIGGFGLYNSGVTVEAGFNVDKFWIGRGGVKGYPFIIQDGIVYIKSAMISQLKADQIDTRGLTIKDAYGKTIFGAGTGLSLSHITGLGTLATKDSVSTTNITGLGSLATKNSVAATDVSGLGSLATQDSVRFGSNVRFPDGTLVDSTSFVSALSKIDSTNISTFISSAAIGGAYIGNAEIDSLQIRGNAVTVPDGVNGYGSIPSTYIYLSVPGAVMVIGMVNWMAPGNSKSSGYITVSCGGILGSTTAISMAEGYSGSAVAIGIFKYLPAGNHLCTFTESHTGTRTLGATSIIAMGVKK